MECKYCYENMITEELITYDNQVFDYCYTCLNYLLQNQFNNYLTSLKTDCKVTLVELIKLGAPRYFRDPMINNHQPIKEFNYKNTVLIGKVTLIDKAKIKMFNLKLLEKINNVDQLDVIHLINKLTSTPY